MELIKKEQTQLSPVERVSQSVIVQTLAGKQFKKVSDSLPKRIEGTFELPKIREMLLATHEKNVCGFIEFELIKLAERINVSGNLTDGQIEFIASQLVGMYPNETIADFKICFEKASVGAYGKAWKLDGVEVGNWMKSYLDEKYTVLESQLMKEKDDQYKKPIQNNDWLQVWKEAIELTDTGGGVKTTSQNMTFASKLKGLTEKEIKEQGQVKPKAKLRYYTSLSEIYAKKLHIEYCRKNYDIYTQAKLSDWKTEQEWVNSLSEENKLEIYNRK